MKQEFRLLKDIIRDYTPPSYPYEPEEGSRMAKQSDYDMVYVLPVSDPNAATMAQKVVQYQAALQLAQTAPQLYDLPQLHRQMLEVLGIKNYQKLVPAAEDMKPTDPVAENQNILKNKPVKAFIEQNHQAHIAVHMAPMQDPKIQSIIGMNPQLAQQLQAAMMAHINEHIGFEYRLQVEKTMGMQLPPMKNQNKCPQKWQIKLHKWQLWLHNSCWHKINKKYKPNKMHSKCKTQLFSYSNKSYRLNRVNCKEKQQKINVMRC
jgi:hypothetical protein